VLVVVAATAERRTVDREVDALRDKLIHTSRVTSLGELAGGLAHELSQPLGAIASDAEAIRRGRSSGRLDEAEIDQALDAIGEHTERGRNVIRSLRSLTARSAPRLVPTDVNETIRSIVRLYQRARPDAASVQLHLEPGLPSVPLDAVQIQQAVLNLLHNADDAMSALPFADRRIEIRTDADQDKVHVRVIDAGTGVSAGDLPHLFDASYSTKTDGLGLGLKITRLIVEAHAGTISLTSNAGRGVTAHLTLPMENRT